MEMKKCKKKIKKRTQVNVLDKKHCIYQFQMKEEIEKTYIRIDLDNRLECVQINLKQL